MIRKRISVLIFTFVFCSLTIFSVNADDSVSNSYNDKRQKADSNITLYSEEELVEGLEQKNLSKAVQNQFLDTMKDFGLGIVKDDSLDTFPGTDVPLPELFITGFPQHELYADREDIYYYAFKSGEERAAMINTYLLGVSLLEIPQSKSDFQEDAIQIGDKIIFVATEDYGIPVGVFFVS